MRKWTVDHIPNLKGITALITGANAGLGYASASVLAQKGATVIMAVRDLDKGGVAAQQIKAQFPHADIVVQYLDLADLETVRSCAQKIKKEHSTLDILMNNAGFVCHTLQLSPQGIELQFATNHLGHFALTAYLLPLLDNAPRGRVVAISSIMHKHGGALDMDAFSSDSSQSTNAYNAQKVYSQTKLANLLFTQELHRRLTAAGKSTISVAAHPGLSATSFSRDAAKIMKIFVALCGQRVTYGALPQIYAAVAPLVQGGEYYGPSSMGEMRGKYPVPAAIHPYAQSKEDALVLWEASEKMSSVSFAL